MLAFTLLFAASVCWSLAPRPTRSRVTLGVAAALAIGGVIALLTHGMPVAQKVIARLVMPTGLIWLSLWSLAALQARRRDRITAIALTLLFALYTLAGNRPLGEYLIARTEAPFVQANPFEQAPFDAVFVLGGGTNAVDGRVYTTAAGDRVVLAARLYHEGLTPVLVTSGRSVPGRTVHVDATEHTTRIWSTLGVPETDIIRLPDPYNTSQELAAYAALIEERGWQRVGLLTSAWHLPRAMRSAARLGVDFVPLSADRRGTPVWNGLESIIPIPGGFDLTYRACWEALGGAVGR
ncbi:MAG: uncharacterized SAM-binding protein YcdF (DUF218 family) [Flavobacteriales bacterium]|jgi:uncharacterized SAM-binding protein YcdF (DUF218 family)